VTIQGPYAIHYPSSKTACCQNAGTRFSLRANRMPSKVNKGTPRKRNLRVNFGIC
jgi:hypothetical protein